MDMESWAHGAQKKPCALKPFDLIIVGGGMTGATLALELHTHFRIAIIEASDIAPRDVVRHGPERAIALSDGTHTQLDRLGIWSDIQALGAEPIRNIEVWQSGQQGQLQMCHQDEKRDALGYVVQNEHINLALSNKLKATDITFIRPATVISMQQQDRRLQLQTKTVEGMLTLKTSLLIGADGTSSRVRHLAGIGCAGWDHNRFGIVASVTPEKPHAGTAFECFRSSGPLALLPLDKERLSIVWTLKPEEATRAMSMPDAVFLAKLGQAAGRVVQDSMGRFSATGARACFPFEYRQSKRYTAKRVALIGNAARTIHPVAGQGFNLGMRDVSILADVILGAKTRRLDIGSRIILDEYASRRRCDNLAVTTFTEGVNALFGNSIPPLQVARGWGLSGLNRLSPLRSWIVRHAAGIAQQPGLKRHHV
ncbi:MAG: UbiH/UbiF/VisC/COQ6 family ubiquinone biosynthesis hydroxylase [Mariprofundaceae bacterium]